MPLRAREMSIAIASTSAPMTTSSAPRKEAVDQRATPATIKRIAGSTPIRKTAPPIARLPVICCPQRSRKREAERLIVSNGPVPSIAITGIEMKVISDQPQRPALIFEQAHDQADRGGDRGPAADLDDPGAGDGEPVADARFLAAEDHVGAGGEADAEVEADEAEDVDADQDQRDRAGQLVVVPEVQAGAEGDDRQ